MEKPSPTATLLLFFSPTSKKRHEEAKGLASVGAKRFIGTHTMAEDEDAENKSVYVNETCAAFYGAGAEADSVSLSPRAVTSARWITAPRRNSWASILSPREPSLG